MSDSGISRRRLLVAGAVLGGAGAVAEAAPPDPHGPDAAPISGAVPWENGAADVPPEAVGRDYVFFTPDEAAFIEAATARIIPKDELGPGGVEAGVPLFIDRQLAGPYGHGDRFYMQGPWPTGNKEQGYQSRYTPAQLYRAAIPAVARYSRDTFGGAFHGLHADDQDRLLTALEKGEAKLDGVDAKGFFTLLLQNVKEGFFSDPIYGGNRDLAGWRMIGFPGARYDYSGWVGRHNQVYDLPPVGLKGRADWREHA